MYLAITEGFVFMVGCVGDGYFVFVADMIWDGNEHVPSMTGAEKMRGSENCIWLTKSFDEQL